MSATNFLSGLPLVGGLFDDTDQKAMDELSQNQKLYGNIKAPTFQQYKPVAYTPEMAQATQVQQDPAIRAQQMQALMRMGGLAQTGLSDVDTAGYEQARNIGNQMENSGNAAALQNAQARGVGGSGLDFAMHEMANSDAAQRANQAGLQQAADSARQRALYNQAYGNALGQMQQQQTGVSAANAGILNNFSQFNTGNQNQANYYNTGQANYAQQYGNQMQQQQYEDQLQKAAGQSGANSAMAGGYAAENAANTSNRNSNTSLAVMGGMGLAGYGPMAKKQAEEE